MTTPQKDSRPRTKAFVRLRAARGRWSAPLVLIVVLVSLCACRTDSIRLPKRADEVCRVSESIYDHGVKVEGLIAVYSDGTYATRHLENQPAPTDTGRISPELLVALKQSVVSTDFWPLVDGVPTCYVNLDDSKTRYPGCVTELRKETSLQRIQRWEQQQEKPR